LVFPLILKYIYRPFGVRQQRQMNPQSTWIAYSFRSNGSRLLLYYSKTTTAMLGHPIWTKV
jgi:hypothetical protein